MILRKIIEIVAKICKILRLKCTKFDFGSGSVPDPAGGDYSAPQIPSLMGANIFTPLSALWAEFYFASVEKKILAAAIAERYSATLGMHCQAFEQPKHYLSASAASSEAFDLHRVPWL